MIIMIQIFVSVFVILIFSNPMEAAKLPPNVTVPAVIGFGDSIIDPGNNNHIKSIIKCNFPPYGKDFMGGVPTGRFSNGRIPTDLLAEEFSIKEYVPAYLDPHLSPVDLPTGVSFASGGCGYDPLTSKIASVISLSQQVEYFKEYAQKVKNFVGEEKGQFIISNSVYMILAGSDDIANTYFDTPFRRKEYDVDSYTNLMINFASQFVQDIYNVGARRIAVFGAPPIGCVPSQRTLGGLGGRTIVRECAEDYNNAATLFNSKLPAAVHSLTSKLPGSRVVYIDAYTPLFDIVHNPRKYGLEETRKGCCGTGLIEVSILCSKFDPVPLCEDDSKFFFWDSYHPTERGYQILISLLIDEFVKLLFGSEG